MQHETLNIPRDRLRAPPALGQQKNNQQGRTKANRRHEEEADSTSSEEPSTGASRQGGKMKAAHKLAAGLGLFLLLLALGYFAFTSLQGAAQQPGTRALAPPATGGSGPPRGAEQDEGARVSPAASSVEEQPGAKQAPAELEAPNRPPPPPPVDPTSSSTSSRQAQEPTETSPSTGTPDGQQSTQDLSAPSPPPSASPQPPSPSPQPPAPPAPEISSTQQTPDGQQEAGLPQAPPAADSPPKTLPTGGGGGGGSSEAPPTSPPSSAEFEPAGPEEPPGPGESLSADKLYKEATQRPGQLVDLSDEESQRWSEFKLKYAVKYASKQEEDQRRMNFIGNLRFIKAFNKHSKALFRLDVNHFADKTLQEINDLYVGPTRNFTLTGSQGGSSSSSIAPAPVAPSAQPGASTTPSLKIMPDPEEVQVVESPVRPAVDWRNLTREPEDQRSCRDSSVWAAMGAIESAVNAAGPSRTKLSEFQVLDCLTFNAPPPPSWPPVCSGLLPMSTVFDFMQSQGIRFSTHEEYSAFAHARSQGQVPPNQCIVPPMAPDQKRPKLNSYSLIERDSFEDALAHGGPLVVAIDASRPTFHFYKSGLYHDELCSPEAYNSHALLVAHTPSSSSSASPAEASEGQPSMASYTIRASFGTDWGEAGHMRLLRDPQRNRCQPQRMAIYPNIAYE